MPVPACATAVRAHPGPSLTQAPFGDLLSSPGDTTVLVGIAAVLYVLSGLVSKRNIRRTRQWSGLVVLVGPLMVREI